MNDGLDRATATLTNGERVLWTGLPDPDIWLTPPDVLLIPFSVLWGGFAVFWEYSVIVSSRAPGVFVVFGGAFVAIAFYMVFFRFLVGHYRRRTTTYILTNRRAIIASPRSLKSARVDPHTLTRSWSRDRGRVSINFGYPQDQIARRPFLRSPLTMAALSSPFTGWDPLDFTPSPVMFQDVLDPAGLESGLAQIARE